MGLSTKTKEATTKIYQVEFCEVYDSTVYGGNYVYSSQDDTKIFFNGKFLISEDEIEKYKNYGGGIKSLTLIGIMLVENDEKHECKCKCNKSKDEDFFVLRFTPEEGGKSCTEYSKHPSMYSMVGKIIQLQEDSELGLNGSKVYNKFEFKHSEDTSYSPITYEEARQIRNELEE